MRAGVPAPAWRGARRARRRSRALSFGSQLDGMVVCDGGGRPLRPAMIWMDRRAEAQAAALAERDLARRSSTRTSARTSTRRTRCSRRCGCATRSRRLWSAAAHADAAGLLRAARSVRGVTGRRLLERVVAGAARSADPDVVGRRSSTRRGSTRAMLPELAAGTQSVGTVTAAFAEATGLSPGHAWSRSGAATRWRRRSAPASSRPARSATWSAPPSPSARRRAEPREDPTMLVECHPHADPDVWLLENPGFVSGGNLRWWRDQFAPIERDAEADGAGRRLRLPVDARPAHVSARRRGARVPAVHAGRDGAGVERRRPRRVLRADARAHARPHDARDAGGERVRAARHPGGDARRRAWTFAASRSSAAARRGRCGGRSRPTSPGCRSGCPRASRRRRPARRSSRPWVRACTPTVADAVDAFVRYRPEAHDPDPATTAAYDDAYARYRSVYSALRPVFGT